MSWVTTPGGDMLPLIDSGVFDWVAQLTNHARNVYVATGMGAQLAAFACRQPP